MTPGTWEIKKDFQELKVRIPYKKPKGGITEAQKEYNKELRRERVVSRACHR